MNNKLKSVNVKSIDNESLLEALREQEIESNKLDAIATLTANTMIATFNSIDYFQRNENTYQSFLDERDRFFNGYETFKEGSFFEKPSKKRKIE